jgi:hydroxymethylpyrimidine pyrophosphatase-like HAD family hydrolase
MKPIKLIYSDNEGCILPGKGVAFPLKDLKLLRSFLKKHRNIGFGICSGRSVPYMEAMVQTLNLLNSPIPCICDGGATLYWPKLDKWESLSPDRESPLDNKKKLLTVAANMSFREEPGKIGCLSLYPNYPTTVESLYNAFKKSAISNPYNITKSVAAVDITMKGISKSIGVKKVCKHLKIALSEVLYIGDAQNDIALLKITGYSACPNNATESVKKVVNYISNANATKGVLEILKHFENSFGSLQNTVV